MATGAITEEEIEAVLASTQEANSAWMRGDATVYDALNTHSDDYTIMGPFGGPTSKGYRGWAERVPHIVKNFRNGTSKLHLIQSYASGDLLVLILEEEQHGEVGSEPDQPWSLRVTQVYRREEGNWKVVHRHADPLVRLRSISQTAALARE